MKNLGLMNFGLGTKKVFTVLLVSFLVALALMGATVIASKQDVFISRSTFTDSARECRPKTLSSVSKTITRTAANPHIYLFQPQALATKCLGDNASKKAFVARQADPLAMVESDLDNNGTVCIAEPRFHHQPVSATTTRS